MRTRPRLCRKTSNLVEAEEKRNKGRILLLVKISSNLIKEGPCSEVLVSKFLNTRWKIIVCWEKKRQNCVPFYSKPPKKI